MCEVISYPGSVYSRLLQNHGDRLDLKFLCSDFDCFSLDWQHVPGVFLNISIRLMSIFSLSPHDGGNVRKEYRLHVLAI